MKKAFYISMLCLVTLFYMTGCGRHVEERPATGSLWREPEPAEYSEETVVTRKVAVDVQSDARGVTKILAVTDISDNPSDTLCVSLPDQNVAAGSLRVSVNYDTLSDVCATEYFLSVSSDYASGSSDRGILPFSIRAEGEEDTAPPDEEVRQLKLWDTQESDLIQDAVSFSIKGSGISSKRIIVVIKLMKRVFRPLPFVQVDGERIVNSRGEDVVLKGLSLTNGVYYVADVHRLSGYNLTSRDYYEMAKMGVGAVRFYIQYEWLDNEEDARAFYRYLDRQLAYARLWGMYVILNLHYFGTDPGEFYHDRDEYDLVSFWKRIARRYRNQSIIAGYDLINEPNCNEERLTEAQLYDVYREIISAIRAEGDNHIVFVADPFKKHDDIEWYLNPANQNKDLGPYVNTDAFQVIDDPNVVYTYHWYKPSEFTHQTFPYNWYFELGAEYPYTMYHNKSYEGGWYDDVKLADTAGQWQRFEGQWVDLGSHAATLGHPCEKFYLSLFAGGADGKVWFDDIVLRKRPVGSQDAGEVLPVRNSSFKLPIKYPTLDLREPYPSAANWYWSSNVATGSSLLLDFSQTHNPDGSGAVLIDGSRINTDQWWYAAWNQAGGVHSTYYEVEPGYEYQITAWIKTEGNTVPAASCGFEFSSPASTVYDKAYNQRAIDTHYVSWAKLYGVPLYCGEFGVANPEVLLGSYPDAPEEQVAWLSDTLEVLDSGTRHWCYHDYRDYTRIGFGLFDSDRNKPLREVLTESMWR